MEKEQIYCSLDIETSGFDPLKDEILEVGFSVFKIEDLRFKIVEEWTQVFKPSKEVSPQILGLTGISQKELDEAPKFSEYHETIQQKLKDAVIVGHNVGFDIKFLESLGIKFSGETIDTLDLAQIFLPTHHSYNLENLMHTFKIKHSEAHRALPDAKAAISLLVALLGVSQSFSEKLKKNILNLIEGKNLHWEELLNIAIPEVKYLNKVKEKPQNSQTLNLKLETKTIYNLPQNANVELELAKFLNSQKGKFLLVIPKIWQVLFFWKLNLVEPVFPPELLFDNEKFNAFLVKKDLSLAELKFLLKILIWRETNWQTKTILDLNMSFFGGQFKELIVGGENPISVKAPVVCMDQETFLNFSKSKKFENRFLAIFGLNEFETNVSWNIGIKVGWGQFIYALKNIYNPELNLGDEGKKQTVLDMLAATDLFFGIVSAVLKPAEEKFSYYKIDENAKSSENYNKAGKAAENFIIKINEANKILNSEALSRYSKNLEEFFKEQDNTVKWIELAQNRCIFFCSPINISPIVKKSISPYKKIVFFDSLNSKLILEYGKTRLGLNGFKFVFAEVKPTIAKKIKKIIQRDLFSGNLEKKSKTEFILASKMLGQEELFKILQQDTLPAAVLFSAALQAKQFYNQYYDILGKEASVFLQSSTGGSNKILRNFGIEDQSILLATDKFILKYLSSKNYVLDVLQQLAVKTLVINRLPFDQYTHPYQEAVSRNFKDPFTEFSLPKALYNFHLILKFFKTPKLEKVYIFDPKLDKDYAKIFKNYLEDIKN